MCKQTEKLSDDTCACSVQTWKTLEHLIQDRKLAHEVSQRPHNTLGQNKHKHPASPNITIREISGLPICSNSEVSKTVEHNGDTGGLEDLHKSNHECAIDQWMDDINRIRSNASIAHQPTLRRSIEILIEELHQRQGHWNGIKGREELVEEEKVEVLNGWYGKVRIAMERNCSTQKPTTI